MKDLKKLIDQLEEAIKDGGYIGGVQPIVWDILEIAKSGGDISSALSALNKAKDNHGCDHGCPVDSTIAETEAFYYKNTNDKKKISGLLNSESRSVKLGTIHALETKFESDPESLSLVIKKLADEDDVVRVDTSTILGLFAKKSKENSKLVLDEIKRANLDRNIREVKIAIWVCRGFDVKRITSELKNKDDTIRLDAAESVAHFAFFEEYDIKELISALTSALGDSNESVKENTAEALEHAAIRKIELPVSDLTKILDDKNDNVRTHVAGALTIYYGNNKQWSKCVEFLKNKDENIRKGCASGLEYFFRMAYWDKKLNKDVRAILLEIDKASIDKNLPEVKEVIRKGNERLNS
ncbi:hypothetical protein J4450_04045 [Candidatus Micrarchaeota archaeon]|nr:hypothetical protein [Candidatus Micrarchaeota archaeon]